jgi:pyridoxamine 5'-phosphate oxidase
MAINYIPGQHQYPPLREEDVDPEPIRQFQVWFDEANRMGLPLPEAMTLATATPQGKPSARMVLLRGCDERGFDFYTNYESRKARELADNPWAALVFFWQPLDRQVRVEGMVTVVSPAESDAYFQSRERSSQLGAWASPQSQILPGRADLERRLKEAEARFSEGPVPRPEQWGGFRLVPAVVEFWQGRPGRLHDRIRYHRLANQAAWLRERLAP